MRDGVVSVKYIPALGWMTQLNLNTTDTTLSVKE